MEASRKLQKMGGSVALTIPAQMAEAMRLEPGQEVILRGDEARIEITTSRWRPSAELLEFAERFSMKYDRTLRELSDS